MKAQTLQLKGATLYYETRGSGPVLLLIAGGASDAGVFEDVASFLAHDYTVVTYDPRGNSRSPLDGPPEDQQIEVHSDGARRLLETVADGPAAGFGSSSGATVGLAVLARHPALGWGLGMTAGNRLGERLRSVGEPCWPSGSAHRWWTSQVTTGVMEPSQPHSPRSYERSWDDGG